MVPVIVGAKGTTASPVPKATPKPKYSLKVIKINCDDTATNRPFIPLRKNYATLVSSEWTYGTTNKAIWGFVCKPTRPSFEINAQFEFKDTNGNNVPVQGTIKVTVGSSKKVISSNEVTMSRSGGNKTSIGKFTFTFPDIKVFSKQVMSITFKYKDIAGKWVNMKKVPVTTYFIPSEPDKPWIINVKNNNHNPWTDALDMLLAKWKVKGLGDTVKIATQITQYTFSSINFYYEINQGATILSKNNVFSCTDFIYNVNKKKKMTGNCSDCATIVRTFSNLLGAKLIQIRFGNSGGYYCNKIKTIGYGKYWQYPFPEDVNGNRVDVSSNKSVRGGFGYHEIASAGSGIYTDKIYDACLKVNKNAVNSTAPAELLPTDKQFALFNTYSRILTSADSIKYREMLVLNELAYLNNAGITGRRECTLE